MPHRRRPSPTFVALGSCLALLALGAGCGGGGGIFSPSSAPVVDPLPPAPPLVLAGSVEAPAGSAVAAKAASGSLSVLTFEDAQPVGDALTFEVAVQPTVAAPQVPVLVDENDNPILLGYELPGTSFSSAPLRRAPAPPGRAAASPVVNARTTALALCMINPLLAGSTNDQKRDLASRIEALAGFDALAAKIETYVAADAATGLDPDAHPDLYEDAVALTVEALKSYGENPATAFAGRSPAIGKETVIGTPDEKVRDNGFLFENWKTVVFGVVLHRYSGGYGWLDGEFGYVEPLGGLFSKFLHMTVKFKLGWPPQVSITIDEAEPRRSPYVATDAVRLNQGKYRVTVYDTYFEDEQGVLHGTAGLCNSISLILDLLSLVVDVRDFTGEDIPKTLMRKIAAKVITPGNIKSLVDSSRRQYSAGRNQDWEGLATETAGMVIEQSLFSFIAGQVLGRAAKKANERLARCVTKSVVKGVLKKIGPGLVASGVDIAKVVTFLTDWIRAPHVKQYYLRDGAISRDPFLPPCERPTFDLAPGVFTDPQTVEIRCATPGARILYTLNGPEPTPSWGQEYKGPIAFKATRSIKAIALKDGMSESAVAEGLYEIKPYVKTPALSVPSGIYTEEQRVTATCATTGAKMYYTLDGSTPSAANGTRTPGVVYVRSTATLKVVGVADGMTDSLPAVAEYRIHPVLPRPYLVVDGVKYDGMVGYDLVFTETKRASLECSVTGADIYYTLDGTVPDEESAVFSPHILIDVDRNLTIKFYARMNGRTDSPLVVANLTYAPYVATPTADVDSGSYTEERTVTLACATAGATIRYTLDGSTPSAANGLVYAAPLPLAADATLKFYALKAGMSDSPVVTRDYVIRPYVATVAIDPPAGTYTSEPTVTLSCATPGVSIRYTTDGSTPTDTYGLVYDGPFRVLWNLTVKAVAIKAGMTTSRLAEAAFVYAPFVATPSISLPSGTYLEPRLVALTCATPGATIRYTTDGSTPGAANGAVYTERLTVDRDFTLKVSASKEGMTDSPVAEAVYVYAPPVAAPTFAPPPGTYTEAQSVAIVCATAAASIRYTTDGSTPTATNGLDYAGPVTVDRNLTLKAFATKAGMTGSAVSEAAYVIAPPVAAPIFDPAPGTYGAPQGVTLACATAGATIRYTTDGTAPSATNGSTYAAPIPVGASATVRAYALKSGMTDSPVAEAFYAIELPPDQVAAPTFGVAPGTYTEAQSVSLACATGGASIYYTTDGSVPAATTGTLYAGPVAVDANATLKAVAVKAGMTDSPVAEAAYVIAPPVATPLFGVAPGTFTESQSVSITCATAGASIYYTTDGSVPTATTGTLYAGPVTVDANATLKAVALKAGMTDSAVASATYTIKPFVATPAFGVPPGLFQAAQEVPITCATGGASIYYTLDGSDPTAGHGALYAGPVAVAFSTTLKAVAVKEGMTDSPVATAAYVIEIPPDQVLPPAFNPPAGTYTEAQAVVIASATGGASIYYTTDGSAPSATQGTLYAGPVAVASSLTLKAVAVKAGMTDSAVSEAIYTIAPPEKAGTPVFSLPAGTYDAAQSVVITCATQGASIYYTTDGSTPSRTNGAPFSVPVVVASDLTLKAVAVKEGLLDSNVTEAAYVIELPQQVAKPTFLPPAGSYVGAQSVALLCETAGAYVYYTTDGSTPSATHGTKFTEAVAVAADTTLKAVAVKDGFLDSEVASAAYVISAPEQVAAPAFSVSAGTYNAAQTVVVTCATAGATVYYTTDGSTPSATNGTTLAGPVAVASSLTLKAVAVKAGMTDSAVTEAAYVIELPPEQVAAPTFDPPAGSYSGARSVTIACATAGATIRYTLDGSDPAGGTVYAGPVAVGASLTLRAVATKPGMTDSEVANAAYVILP